MVQIETVFLNGKVGIAAGALGLSAALAAGQTAPAESCRVRVPLTIFDASGRAVKEGVEYAVRPREKGVRLISARQESADRRVILLLDLSGSMLGETWNTTFVPKGYEDPWKEALELTRIILRELQPGDWAALHVFAANHRVEVPLTENREAVASALDALPQPGSQSARAQLGLRTLLGSTLEAIVVQESALRPGDAIVMISDGYVASERMAFKHTVHQLSAAGVRFYLLRVGLPNWEPPELDLAKLSRETGGHVLKVWEPITTGSEGRYLGTPGGLAGAAKSLVEMVRRFDWVELEFEKCDGKARNLTLELRAKKGRKTGYEELLYPRQVVLPAPGSEPKN